MPLTIPAFDQYQAPMFPLRGLWNNAPPEGDKFCNAEIDWLVTTKSQAVQFSLSGNSPVALSQIVALCVDNSRSGADVDFIFPDSGFLLTVPAHNQVVAPVFTNALMFYASAPNAIAGDVTVLQILNSMPPPIPIAPSSAQNHQGISGIAVSNTGVTQLIAAGITGTITNFQLVVPVTQGATAGTASFVLFDGRPVDLWNGAMNVAANATVNETLGGPLGVRFVNGLVLDVVATSLTPGPAASANVYYTTP